MPKPPTLSIYRDSSHYQEFDIIELGQKAANMLFIETYWGIWPVLRYANGRLETIHA